MFVDFFLPLFSLLSLHQPNTLLVFLSFQLNVLFSFYFSRWLLSLSSNWASLKISLLLLLLPVVVVVVTILHCFLFHGHCLLYEQVSFLLFRGTLQLNAVHSNNLHIFPRVGITDVLYGLASSLLTYRYTKNPTCSLSIYAFQRKAINVANEQRKEIDILFTSYYFSMLSVYFSLISFLMFIILYKKVIKSKLVFTCI